SRELGGTGLGLSIVKHIVESHGGTLQAESRLGVGTRFVIRIPGARDPGSEPS
ncbi:MAG: PAS domain-containing sensor histidine kinase, partial [Deltaproteobacteria bacterium]